VPFVGEIRKFGRIKKLNKRKEVNEVIRKSGKWKWFQSHFLLTWVSWKKEFGKNGQLG